MPEASVPFRIKNTFITVDQDDEYDDTDIVKFPSERMMTEPACEYHAKWKEAEPTQQQEIYSRKATKDVFYEASVAVHDLEPPPEWIRISTVIIGEIPCHYTQALLLEEINSIGLAGCYDFFYLPFDQHSQTNRGYAFINFKESSQAWEFKMQFESSELREMMPITLEPAEIQGFDENYRLYGNTSCAFQDAPEFQPLFLRSVDNTAMIRPGDKQSTVTHQESTQILYSNQETDAKSLKRFCPYCGNTVLPCFLFCMSCGLQLPV